LGGEKLKPLHHYCYKFRVTLLTLCFALGIIGGLFVGGPILGAQDAGDTATPGVVEAERVPVDPLAGEREIFLGEEPPGLPVASPGPVSGFAVLRTVLLLILAAAAIYGVVYVVRKLSRPQELLDPNLRILASARLGPNRFVHVLALGTKGWLVGSGEGGISHIADSTDQEALDTLFLEESRRNAETNSGRWDFRSLLRRLGIVDRGTGPHARIPPEGTQTSIQPDEIRRRRERLKGL
jgi:flagellar biogenesis protein FliO